MRIDSSGNVGIGVSSPARKLHISGGASVTYLQLSNDASGNTNADGFQIAQDGANVNIINREAGYITLDTSNTERMRITSGGDMLVNTTSSTGHKMTVQAASSAGAIDCVGTSTNGYYALRVDMPSTNTYGVLFRNNGNNVGDIRVNSSSTAYNTSSDYRLKENILPMTGALNKVAQLKPVTYDWKAGGSSQGFIAHELQAVVPDAVTGEKDAVNEDGSIKPQGIDTSFLVATLTAAIQEQQQIINDLKARIETLESK
jgi:hypothetical protein